MEADLDSYHEPSRFIVVPADSDDCIKVEWNDGEPHSLSHPLMGEETYELIGKVGDDYWYHLVKCRSGKEMWEERGGRINL